MPSASLGVVDEVARQGPTWRRQPAVRHPMRQRR